MSEDSFSIADQAQVVAFSRLLIDSYRNLVGSNLVEPSSSDIEISRALFSAPFVVVAHGTQVDPILCYGNLAALKLWEMTWDQLTSTPSRLTAEPGARDERERLLRDALTCGFSQNYRGVRISSTGKRFWIEDVTVWNVLNDAGERIGQAAMFEKWKMIDNNAD